jgi:formamidopyrimidine-DNA glycosylase
MPELPDVQVFKEYFDATALHQRVAAVDKCHRDLLQGVSPDRLGGALEGHSFTATVRHGKWLLARAGEDGWLVLHFGMTGYLRYYKKEDKAPGHIRLLLRFDNGYRLAFDCLRKLGRIGFSESVEKFIEEQDLGPDALEVAADVEKLSELLQDKRGSIKSALMDQHLLAGIGNIYSDEILFAAGVRPQAKVQELSAEKVREIARAMDEVLRGAIDCRVGEEGWPEGKWLVPHREDGEKCPRCGGRIKKEKISGRSSYFCRDHQG